MFNTPFPQSCVHIPGIPQNHPQSIKFHVLDQPSLIASLSMLFPSSQISPTAKSIYPSPHCVYQHLDLAYPGTMAQAHPGVINPLDHPSVPVSVPVSHSSPGSKTPFPGVFYNF